MKSQLFKVMIVMLLGIILAACGAATQQNMSTAESAGSTVQVVSSPTQVPSPTTTPTAEPSPTPTQVPLPEVIDGNTVSDLQIVRSFLKYPDEPSNLMRTSFSLDQRFAASWGCTYQTDSNSTCAAPLLILFDMNTGKVLQKLEPLTTIVENMRFSPDGVTLALSGCHTPIQYYGQPDTTCTEPRVWLVDTATGEITHELKGYSSPVKFMDFSPDGKTLYTGILYSKGDNYPDSTIRIWDVASGKKLSEIQPAIADGTKVTPYLSPDGRYLITHLYNLSNGHGKVDWWDLESPSSKAIYSYQGIQSAISPDSKKIAVMESFDNMVIHIYDLQTGEKIKTIPTGLRNGSPYKFSFAPDSKSLLLTDSKTEKGEGYAIININNEDLITRTKPALFEMSPDAAYAFSPDGKLLVIYGSVGDYKSIMGDYDPKISVWDTTTWKEIAVAQPYFSLASFDQPSYLAFSPDQKRLLAYSDSNVTQFGLPVKEQEPARKFLLEYLDKLSNGKYAEAANDLKYSDESMISESLSGKLPGGVDPKDKVAVLKALCTNEKFPCLPLLKVTYEAQTLPDTYLFRVQFSNSDGTPAIWPPCKDLPKDKYCDFRTEFDYTVQEQPDGSFKILDTLPYSLWLDK
jgi:WD40 repeat protein